VSVRIYVEGGFEGTTKSNCRKAFRIFFEKTLPRGSFQVIASGDRAKAYADFCTALVQHPGDYVMLLVDSEEAVSGKPWEHVITRVGDGWQRPRGAKDDQLQFMVQVMESWFLADQDALAAYYGQGFRRSSMPRRENIEEVSKTDVYRALENATKDTQKREYHKTRHGFELVELIDPALVQKASGQARRLHSSLERETATV
jgi:hypothetical protein